MENLENMTQIADLVVAGVGALGGYIMLDILGIPNQIRLYIDRKILGKDSQIIMQGLPYTCCETYIPGSKKRKLDNNPIEVRP